MKKIHSLTAKRIADWTGFRRSYHSVPSALVETDPISIACVASVSVLFPSKDRAKNGVSKRGEGGEERKETLADKPRDFDNRPHRLSCLSVRTDI